MKLAVLDINQPKLVVSVVVDAEDSFLPKLLANSFRIRCTVLADEPFWEVFSAVLL